MSHPVDTRRVQTVHFDTTHETSKWLAHPLYASASPPSSSAGSPTFYTRPQLPQSRWGDSEPVGHHSASGGDAHENRPAPYESPDDEGSASASDTAPPARCRRLQAHRAVPHATLRNVPDTGVCLHHRRLPVRRRDASRHDGPAGAFEQKFAATHIFFKCPPWPRWRWKSGNKPIFTLDPALGSR